MCRLVLSHRLRRYTAEAASFAIRWSGTARLIRRLTARRGAILVYHDPTPTVLERHLGFLARHYELVSVAEIVTAMRSERWTLSPRALAVTLDDGLSGNLDLMPVFASYGVRPTIYICSSAAVSGEGLWFMRDLGIPVEQAKRLPNAERLALLEREGPPPQPLESAVLGSAELAEVRGYAEIGSHTRSHEILTTCDDATCALEISGSKREIEEMLDIPCRHFAYPNGDYTVRELALVEEAGYLSGRTMDIGWNTHKTDPYRLRVLPTHDDASLTRLVGDLSGVVPFIVRLLEGGVRGTKRPITLDDAPRRRP